jgi:hypothetical protein
MPGQQDIFLHWNREKQMKAFLLACAAAIVVAVVGAAALNTIQKPVAEAFSTTGVRL